MGSRYLTRCKPETHLTTSKIIPGEVGSQHEEVPALF